MRGKSLIVVVFVIRMSWTNFQILIVWGWGIIIGDLRVLDLIGDYKEYRMLKKDVLVKRQLKTQDFK